jgi:Rrf2 family iron-sulfur cluster assembly transcriptional regulator
LDQIFSKLRKAGIVTSIRGPGGGFRFSQPLDKLTVKEIFDAAGEDMELSFCDKHIENCVHDGDCMSHHVFTEITRRVNAYFSELTLASIIEKYGNSPIPILFDQGQNSA